TTATTAAYSSVQATKSLPGSATRMRSAAAAKIICATNATNRAIGAGTETGTGTTTAGRSLGAVRTRAITIAAGSASCGAVATERSTNSASGTASMNVGVTIARSPATMAVPTVRGSATLTVPRAVRAPATGRIGRG